MIGNKSLVTIMNNQSIEQTHVFDKACRLNIDTRHGYMVLVPWHLALSVGVVAVTGLGGDGLWGI